LKTHDLIALARAAGITLTPAEVTRLERLTDFVEWAGRYPAGVCLRPHVRVQYCVRS
jgi:hypothetical protein